MSVKDYEEVREQMRKMIGDIISEEQDDSEEKPKQPKIANNIKSDKNVGNNLSLKNKADKVGQDLLKQYGYIK